MTAFIIIISIILLFWMWPYIMRLLAPYFQNWIVGKMEDRMRRMMGMPTRKEERKAARKKEKEEKKERGKGKSQPSGQSRRGKIIPPEYAEDVEFVEYKNVSETEIIKESPEGKTEYYYESQIEDVEFIEIKGESRKEK